MSLAFPPPSGKPAAKPAKSLAKSEALSPAKRGETLAAFERQARAAVGELRAAFDALLDELKLPKRRPIELQRTLGIDYRLAWQVVNVASADDVLLAGKHVPQASSIRRLITAAADRGVKAKTLDVLQAASGAFESLVIANAEDRTSFDAMLASLGTATEEGDEAISTTLRRNAYRLNSSIWGVQVETFWTCTINLPPISISDGGSPPAQSIGGIHLGMKKGLRRLRADAPILVERVRSGTGPASVQPVDPDAFKRHGAALLPEFCSRPTPKLLQEPQADGWKQSLLADNRVGRSSTVDLVFGKVALESPGDDDSEGFEPAIRSTTTFVTPAELAVIDILVPRSAMPVKPWVKIYSTSDVFKRVRGTAEVPVLPLAVPIVHEPDGLRALGHRAVPNAEAIVRHAGAKMGWVLEDFALYRVQLEYPVLHSVLWFQLDAGI